LDNSEFKLELSEFRAILKNLFAAMEGMNIAKVPLSVNGIGDTQAQRSISAAGHCL
jgi:hypothetical protein